MRVLVSFKASRYVVMAQPLAPRTGAEVALYVQRRVYIVVSRLRMLVK